MTRADGAAQTGVYLAGSQHADGHVTVVINPSAVVPPRFDVRHWQPPVVSALAGA